VGAKDHLRFLSRDHCDSDRPAGCAKSTHFDWLYRVD